METGSAITWKYPSVVLVGEGSVGEFYSVALTNNHQQADTGSKMIHVGANTRSRIISKGISAGQSRNCYRGLVQARLPTPNFKPCVQTLRPMLHSNAALPAASCSQCRCGFPRCHGTVCIAMREPDVCSCWCQVNLKE